MEEYTDKEPFDLEKSATAISVKKSVGEDGRMEVSARFPLGPTPLYFGPPFTFDSSEFVSFSFSFSFFSFFVFSNSFNNFLSRPSNSNKLFPFLIFLFQECHGVSKQGHITTIVGYVVWFQLEKKIIEVPSLLANQSVWKKKKMLLLLPQIMNLQVEVVIYPVKRRWIFMKKILRFVLNIFFFFSLSLFDQFFDF